ncbi:FAD dependent oxidoreductase [Nemania sp. FL0916]|nr:FAD dependent oxidoreductase [Nemania sp. FL0916]
MDERAAIPVTLPRDNPTQSYWQLEVDGIADLRTTDSLPSEAETVIIGSGITGAAVAYHLTNHGPRDIVMLEARQACSGATGRNGGHTKAPSYLSYRSSARAFGSEEAVKILRLEQKNKRRLHEIAREHNLECESNPCTTMDVVYDAKQWDSARESIAAIQEAMPPGDDDAKYTFHSADEVREKYYCGQGQGGMNENICGGITYEAGSINSYKYTIGVLKMCLDRGMNLQTNTPATSVTRLPEGGYKVKTRSRGTIIAQRVVLATNAYTANLLPKFQGIIVPLRGHVTAQRPGLNMPKDGLPGSYTFFYETGYDYMIPRPQTATFGGDIVIGGRLASAPSSGLYEYGTTDDTTADQATMRDLGGVLPRYFGENWGADDPEGRVRTQWTGIMGYGPDGLPFVGEMPGEKNLWVAASFQGHGMVMCWESARALVEMMEGRDNEELRSWFPDAYRITEPRFHLKFEGRKRGAR